MVEIPITRRRWTFRICYKLVEIDKPCRFQEVHILIWLERKIMAIVVSYELIGHFYCLVNQHDWKKFVIYCDSSSSSSDKNRNNSSSFSWSSINISSGSLDFSSNWLQENQNQSTPKNGSWNEQKEKEVKITDSPIAAIREFLQFFYLERVKPDNER